MGETPVTQAQFGEWTRSAGIEHGNYFSGSGELPAESLDWQMANQYCAWLTEICRDQIPHGWRACLPTEAEWEYACRAGTETEYWSGDGEEALRRVGWYKQNSEGRTHSVGEKAGNGWGLKDMHGNVCEWCHDVWREDGYRWRVDGEEDSGQQEREREWGEGRASNRVRVLRGGPWDFSAGDCRSASRFVGRPDDRDGVCGFRVCLVPGPQGGEERGGGAGTGRGSERDASGVGPSGRSRGESGERASRPDLTEERISRPDGACSEGEETLP